MTSRVEDRKEMVRVAMVRKVWVARLLYIEEGTIALSRRAGMWATLGG